MTNSQQGSKYNLRGAFIAGGIAETVHGDQKGGIINNYGISTSEVVCLIASLRDQVQSFPSDYKNEAIDVLYEVERETKEPQPSKGRLARKVAKLLAIATAIAGISTQTATFSGNISEFTNDIRDLAKMLDVSTEQIQP